VSFGLVELSGVAVHLLVFALVYSQVLEPSEAEVRAAFLQAQTSAVITAACSNFLINNAPTFRGKRLRSADADGGA